MSARPFASRLLAWFARHRRDLPFRRDRSPYSVLVSELMLQQTTVKAAGPYFERFVAELPDWNALARASEDTVLRLWAGLGYYRRARSLHAAARAVVERHGGELPASHEAVLALPGVGPYTAGAVLSLAHGLPVPAVDGNAGRVLSRWRGRPWDVARARDRRAVEDEVRALMPARRAGDFTEALMELGATTCTPRAPACGRCPLASDCVARREGRVAELPPARPRAALREVRAAAAVVLARGRVLLWRRPADAELLAGLWELPGGFTGRLSARAYLEREVLPSLGGGRAVEELGRVRHVITHRRITVELLRCELDAAPRGAHLVRVRPEDAGDLGLTAATAKALARIARGA